MLAMRPPLSSRRRGFSLLELTIALVIFGILSSIITVSIGRASAVSAKLRIERSVGVALAALTDRVASVSFASLVEDTYPRPDACPTQPLLTCITVLDREYQVAWSSELALLDGSSSVGAVTVTATTSLPGGEALYSERTVTAPVSGWDTSNGYLTVTVSGYTFGQSLYLIDAKGNVVGTGTTDETGNVPITAKASSCTNAAPCRVALTPEGDLSSAGMSLSPGSVLGVGGEVVLRAGASTAITVLLYPDSSITTRLLARNLDGTLATPTVTGSVCLWLVFNDGIAERWVPGCNATEAGQITWDSYRAGSGPNSSVGMGQGEYRVSAQGPDDTCPRIKGQKVYRAGTWEVGSDCASTTWGEPAFLSLAGIESSAASAFDVEQGGATAVDVIWTSAAAAGYSGQPSWSWPRDSANCSQDASCVPVELEPCAPGEHCHSSAEVAPWLTSPKSGLWGLPLVVQPESEGTFTLTFGSVTGRIDVRLHEAPVGPLGTDQSPLLQAGNTIGRVNPGQPVTLAYERGKLASDSFVLKLVGVDGSFRLQRVDIVGEPGVFSVSARNISVAQGKQTPLVVRVVGTDGNPLAGADISITGQVGIGGGEAATDATGSTLVPVEAADDLAAGAYTVQVTASVGTGDDATVGTATITVRVTPSPAQVDVEDITVAQGGRGATIVTVLDGAGDPIADLLVGVAVLTSGATAVGVRATDGCYTSANGSCSIPLVVDKLTASGNYDLVAVAGQVTGEGTLTVSTGPGRILVTGQVTVTQGKTTTINVTVVDGNGAGKSGQQLSATGERGLTATPGLLTDSLGQTTLTLSALSSAPSGSRTVKLTAGEVSSTLSVWVRGTPRSIEVSEVTIPQGGAGTVEIVVLDSSQRRVANAQVRLGPTTGIAHPATLTTTATGTARVPLQVAAAMPTGDRSVMVSDEFGAALGEIPVRVTAGVGSVRVLDSAVSGESTQVRILVNSTAQTPMDKLAVTLVSGTTQVIISPATATSGSDGVARFTISVRAGTPSGAKSAMVGINGQNYPVSIMVSPP